MMPLVVFPILRLLPTIFCHSGSPVSGSLETSGCLALLDLALTLSLGPRGLSLCSGSERSHVS